MQLSPIQLITVMRYAGISGRHDKTWPPRHAATLGTVKLNLHDLDQRLRLVLYNENVACEQIRWLTGALLDSVRFIKHLRLVGT